MREAYEWKEFCLGELFEIRPTKTVKISGKRGKTPILSNTSLNNGVKEYVCESPVENGNVVTFSDTTNSASTVFYQKTRFIGFSHVQVMLPRVYGDLWNEKSYLFLISCFKKAIGCGYNYANKFNRDIANELTVFLPVTPSGSPDFDYMSSYISELETERVSELETERVSELEAYLAVTELDDYELTEEDKEVLEEMEKGKVRFGEFKISELFGPKVGRGQRLIKLYRKPGNTPLVTAGEQNQGIAEYIDNDGHNTYSNVATIDMFGNTFYRDYEFCADDNILILKNDNFTREIYLFVVTAINMNKSKYSYGKQYRQKTYIDDSVLLPENQDNLPDFSFMSRYIRAIEKQVIANVYEGKGKIIEKTKEIIQQDS